MLKSLTARAIVPVTVAVTGFVIVGCLLLYTIMKTDMTNETIKYATPGRGNRKNSVAYQENGQGIESGPAGIGEKEKGGIKSAENSSHAGYLAGFYFFYHFSGALPENFWAVFATGVTILGLESYHIWIYCSEEIEKEREVLESIN